ncbi:MAG: hypothetical protein AAGF86_16430, partial [Pseudomonadota bacterium]
IKGTAQKDIIKAKAARLIIDAGAGPDDVRTEGIGTVIHAGPGNNTVSALGYGSIVHLTGGANTVNTGNNLQINGVGHDDRIMVADKVLTGGYGALSSEKETVRGRYTEEYGFNKDVLVIEFGSGKTFITKAKSGPDVANPTANITVFKYGFDAFLAFRGDRKGEFTLDWFPKTLDLIARALFGKQWEENWRDPLVLDLDGDGLELTSIGAGAVFDQDADMFGEPTGWVRPDDGLLARDLDGDGLISSIDELFGGVTGDGFLDLAVFDTGAEGGNGDGVIDGDDAVFDTLSIWRDLDQDGVTDEGELFSLAEAGIASISLTTRDPEMTENAQNLITAESLFTRTDGTTSTIADVLFNLDDYNSIWLGDDTVSEAAAALPNIKGTGELPDFHVSMTLDDELRAFVEANISGVTAQTLEGLRAQVKPMLLAWAASAQQLAGESAHRDVPIKIGLNDEGLLEVVDFAWLDGTVWTQAKNGEPLYCALEDCDDEEEIDFEAIDYSELELPRGLEGVSEAAAWRWLDGETISFLEKHLGRDLPIENPANTDGSAVGAVNSLIEFALNRMDMVSVRLAMQGPLAEYFEGLEYNVESNDFSATTDRQLVPMFEAIFERAPDDAGDAANYLEGWQSILDVVLSEFKRGGSLEVTYDYLVANAFAAYETTSPPLDFLSTASALGVPDGLIISNEGDVAGTDGKDIITLGAGDDHVRGGEDRDVYVLARAFDQVIAANRTIGFL